MLPWAKAVSGVNKAELHTARSPATIARAKNRRPVQLLNCVILYPLYPPLNTSVVCATILLLGSTVLAHHFYCWDNIPNFLNATPNKEKPWEHYPKQG
jgi:hypothetical protein